MRRSCARRGVAHAPSRVHGRVARRATRTRPRAPAAPRAPARRPNEKPAREAVRAPHVEPAQRRRHRRSARPSAAARGAAPVLPRELHDRLERIAVAELPRLARRAHARAARTSPGSRSPASPPGAAFDLESVDAADAEVAQRVLLHVPRARYQCPLTKNSPYGSAVRSARRRRPHRPIRERHALAAEQRVAEHRERSRVGTPARRRDQLRPPAPSVAPSGRSNASLRTRASCLGGEHRIPDLRDAPRPSTMASSSSGSKASVSSER